MDRRSYFNFTIEGDDLDPIAVKEAIELPCEIYYKGQVSKSSLTGKDIVNCAPRWLYEAKSRRNAKTESFLTKQLEIILQKLSILKKYIKIYTTYIEITIYEDDLQDENILLTPKIIKLFNEIGVEILISFVNVVAIYGEDRIEKIVDYMGNQKRGK